jgi:hypothetical protein
VVNKDPGSPHLVAYWVVPLLVGGTPVTVSGSLRWTRPGVPTWVPVTIGITVLLLGLLAFTLTLDARRARESDAEFG